MTGRYITVERPGLLTTVQDLGRRGYQHLGIPVAGAADSFAIRVANLLVGNNETDACLECTLSGPTLRWSRDAVIAITGAEVEGIPTWRPVRIAAGEVLNLSRFTHGCRAYVAVAGGIDVPSVLGSRSTYVRANLGGYQGRALKSGDHLTLGELRHQPPLAIRSIPVHHRPSYSSSPSLRVLHGPQADWLADAAWAELLSVQFSVSTQSDRMGLRLRSDRPLLPEKSLVTAGKQLISEPTVAGSLQLPPDGHPILLLADCQTLGGYPKPATVISADLPLLAQLRPRDTVQFRLVSLQEAQHLLRTQQQVISTLKYALSMP